MLPTEYTVVLTDITAIRPSEEVDEGSVIQLAKNIAMENMWLSPIPIERTIGVVMDGNHRVRAARLLGLLHLPCIHLDYDDPRVSVLDWNTGVPFQIEKIFRTIKENRILPYKSTKHCFNPPLPRTCIPLELLFSVDECQLPDCA